MSNGRHNTLFLRLAGPMQSWGTSSVFKCGGRTPIQVNLASWACSAGAKGVHR